MNIDCSLVQVHFETSNRIEWIYRGSSRLSPMYKEELAATNRIQNKPRTTRMLANSAIVSKTDFKQKKNYKLTDFYAQNLILYLNFWKILVDFYSHIHN